MTRTYDMGDGALLNQNKNRETLLPDYVITFTTGGPATADARTVADGAAPTVVETGRFMADMEKKINDVFAVLIAQGLMKSA